MLYALVLGEVFDAISRWDTAWFYMINLGTQNRIFDLIMPILSDIKLWRWPLAIVMLGALLLGDRRVRITVLLAIILLVLSDQISSHLLKPLVARYRPSHVLEGVRLLVPRGGRLSFPSSHACNVFAIWKLIAVRHVQVAPYLLIIALGVAYSRVYVGVHYPLDVVAGAVLGVLLALGVLEISEWVVFRPLARRRRARVDRRDRKDRS